MFLIYQSKFFILIRRLKNPPVVVKGIFVNSERINRRVFASSERSCFHALKRYFKIIEYWNSTHYSYFLSDFISLLSYPKSFVYDDTGSCL